MSTLFRIAGLSGSLRKGSYNTQLLRELPALLPEDMELDIISFGHLPAYNADLDVPAAKQRPADVVTFRDTLALADGLIIVSPEYNYSIPGALKNTIDWASRGEDSPLRSKPVALMGVTPGNWGTVRMQAAFLPVFQFMDMKPVLQPEVLVAKAGEKFDAQGHLKDNKTKDIIRKKLEALKQLLLPAKSANK